MPSHRRIRSRGAHPRPLTLLALSCSLLATGALTGCSDDSGGSSASTGTVAPSARVSASFSGELPSAIASSAASRIASARASASAAVSSVSARASEFEASVSAEFERRSTAAKKALQDVEGQGNAMSEVTMSGLARADTGGVLAVLVRITNRTDSKASYAVRIDFEDAQHKVVETRYTGAEDLAPGKREQPIVFSHEPAEPKLTPRLAQAQRY
ncbi:hypothetical protein AB0G49_24565 [Streptomyces longwoodensis]|uniref:hypothetical protein n=1 Tax=Streptomyces longwoodensis TaxID=68231 RepID=UPI0033DED81C